MFTNSIGEAEIKEKSIKIRKYPFRPSFAYPEKEILAEEITEIHLEKYPPTLKVGDDLIFISRVLIDELTEFSSRNQIKTAKRASNWDWITEPFLDTEFDEKDKERTVQLLEANGILSTELTALREEISKQMYKYNFGTMLWEWCNLGLSDVLAAMKPKLKRDKFTQFYWKAMEVEQRIN